ncbi:amino acid adenylation domain-containing protein [Streptomyces sp. NPDC059900]|uniref:non-ribosomal peptide synthetase n=1 Tax=Streptomyces sp. NPDC059900 TaxID=3155816 RepID=UPI00341BDC85
MTSYPMSYEQESIWLNDQLQDGASRYIESWNHRLRGPISPQAVRAALTALAARHPALRTRFTLDQGQPAQIVHPPGPVPLTVETTTPESLTDDIRRAIARPLRLDQPPLLRATLLRLAPDDSVLVVTLHHAVIDGWCFRILDLEFSELYRAAVSGETPRLPDPRITPGQYAATQRAHGDDEHDELLTHWQTVLAGAPDESAIPGSKPRPAALDHRGGQARFTIDAALADRIRDLARARRTTTFAILAAALTALVARFSGQDDVVIGTPVSRRDQDPDLESVIACLTDVLPLRQQLTGATTFDDLMRSTQRTVWDAISHRDLPFGKLAKACAPDHTLARFPLFQVVLTVDDAAAPGLDLPGLRAERVHVHDGTAKFDLFFHLVPDGGGYLGLLEYADALYDADVARHIGHCFTTLLDQAVTHPETPLDDFDAIPAPALAAVTAPRAAGPGTPDLAPVHEMFRERAAEHPDAVAVTHATSQLTYRQLDEASDELAARLHHHGTRSGDRIAVSLERSLDVPVAVLAVLKAGGCCVPVDPAYPARRIQHMVDGSSSRLLLTRGAVKASLPPLTGLTVVDLDTAHPAPTAAHPAPRPLPRVTPDDLAYVVHTSGSTGRPKAVAMPHRSLARLADWQHRRSTSERTLQFAPFSFDVFFQELFATWAGGGTLVLTDDATRKDPERLMKTLVTEDIDRLFLPFVALQQLAEYAAATNTACTVREVITSGEQLHVTPAIRRYFADGRCTLDNQYGPSETHVVSAHLLTGDPGQWPDRPPIGTPVHGARLYVLNARQQPLAPGMLGEICIGGPALARGYLDNPRATDAAFRTAALTPDGPTRIYRSGDFGRFLPDGTLEFAGRRDSQLKIRGHRVEPAEVETALRHLPGLADAAVIGVPLPGGGHRLEAHCVATAGAPRMTLPELRAALRDVLPDHCMPARLTAHDALPLTPSGKLDRAALAASTPRPADAPDPAADTSPDPRRRCVARAWQDVLGRPPAHPSENFFDAGGDSLLAVRLVLALRGATGVHLPLPTVFAAPTVAGLAERLSAPHEPAAAHRAQLPPVTLPADIRPSRTADPTAVPRRLVLTGATGFLGAYLLGDLLTRTDADIHCLVRASDDTAAHRRVIEALRRYDLWRPAWSSRIRAVAADLAAPRCGLSEERFAHLARTADAVYHCGADVNLAHSYDQLKDANVGGTIEMLRLAAAERTVPLHHVSTVGVLAPETAAPVHADDPLPPPTRLRHGYAQTKWAAEAVIDRARERGLPVTVYRPTRIAPDSRTGACQEADYFWLLVKSSLEAGLAPTRAGLSFDLVPVDHVARTLVHLSRQPAASGRTFHIAAEDPLRLSTAVGWLREAGHTLADATFEEWSQRIETSHASPTGLALLGITHEHRPSGGREPAFDTSTTLALLPRHEHGHLAFTRPQFLAAVEAFTAAGFLPSPAPGPAFAAQEA